MAGNTKKKAGRADARAVFPPMAEAMASTRQKSCEKKADEDIAAGGVKWFDTLEDLLE
jgi:hypothetical protein